jgi:hypothetical protein
MLSVSFITIVKISKNKSQMTMFVHEKIILFENISNIFTIQTVMLSITESQKLVNYLKKIKHELFVDYSRLFADYSHYWPIIRTISSNYLPTILRLFADYLPTYYSPTIRRLFADYLPTIRRLFADYSSTIRRLFADYSPTFRRLFFFYQLPSARFRYVST